MLGSQQEAGGSFSLPLLSLFPGLGKDSALKQLWEKRQPTPYTAWLGPGKVVSSLLIN